MNTDKPIHANKDSAVGLAHKNIDILAKHRKELLNDLYVTEFDNTHMHVGDAYFDLDLAFLRAIHAEADRAIKFAASV